MDEVGGVQAAADADLDYVDVGLLSLEILQTEQREKLGSKTGLTSKNVSFRLFSSEVWRIVDSSVTTSSSVISV